MQHLWDELNTIHSKLLECIEDTAQWEQLPSLVTQRGDLMQLLGDLIHKGHLPAATEHHVAELKFIQNKLIQLMQAGRVKMKSSIRVSQKYRPSLK